MTTDPKEEPRPVTAEERATLLIGRQAASHWDWSILQDEIVKQIKQAESIAYAEGFKAAREEATGIAENLPLALGRSPTEDGLRLSIADRIRSLSPEREK